MAANEPGQGLMHVIDPPQRCDGCAVFSLLADVVRSALAGGLARQALPPPAPGGGHRAIAAGRTGQAAKDATERVARIRGVMHACLGSIEDARKVISRAARFGDGVPTATMIEILHATGAIQKEVKRGREALAGVR